MRRVKLGPCGERLGQWRCLIAIIAIASGFSLAMSAGGPSPAAAHGSDRVRRCGYASSPYGKLGVYIEKGQVPCRGGRRSIRRAFYATGESVGPTDSVRYPDGWVCGGQMGTYFCGKPLWLGGGHPRQYVLALACRRSLNPAGCPGWIDRHIP
jgi:hypothetical protein